MLMFAMKKHGVKRLEEVQVSGRKKRLSEEKQEECGLRPRMQGVRGACAPHVLHQRANHSPHRLAGAGAGNEKPETGKPGTYDVH